MKRNYLHDGNLTSMVTDISQSSVFAGRSRVKNSCNRESYLVSWMNDYKAWQCLIIRQQKHIYQFTMWSCIERGGGRNQRTKTGCFQKTCKRQSLINGGGRICFLTKKTV